MCVLWWAWVTRVSQKTAKREGLLRYADEVEGFWEETTPKPSPDVAPGERRWVWCKMEGYSTSPRATVDRALEDGDSLSEIGSHPGPSVRSSLRPGSEWDPAQGHPANGVLSGPEDLSRGRQGRTTWEAKVHLGGAVAPWESGQSLPWVWAAGVGEALTLPCQGCLSQKQSLKLCLFHMMLDMMWVGPTALWLRLGPRNHLVSEPPSATEELCDCGRDTRPLWALSRCTLKGCSGNRVRGSGRLESWAQLTGW